MKPLQVVILADSLSLSSKGTVDVAVIGTEDVDVSKADQKSFIFGITYPNPDVDLNAKRPHAQKAVVADVNGDGIKDLVLTFPAAEAATYGFKNVVTDLWLYGTIDGKKTGGFNLVKIVE